MDAMFSPSWNAPVLTAPSPQAATATSLPPRSFVASPAPAARVMLVPTMPDGMTCLLQSVTCIEPPRPWQ